MNNAELGNILNSRDNLLEESAGFLLFYLLIGNNVVKELAPICILHDQVKLFLSLDDLI